jgi:hypothetical protein
VIDPPATPLPASIEIPPAVLAAAPTEISTLPEAAFPLEPDEISTLPE